MAKKTLIEKLKGAYALARINLSLIAIANPSKDEQTSYGPTDDRTNEQTMYKKTEEKNEMANKIFTEKTEEETPTDVRFIEGGLVKGKLEIGADGLMRKIIETHDKNRYYTIIKDDKGNWVTESPITPRYKKPR